MSEGRTSARQRNVYRPLLVVLCAAVGIAATGVMLLAGGRIGEDVSVRLYERFARGPAWLTYHDRSYSADPDDYLDEDDEEYVDEYGFSPDADLGDGPPSVEVNHERSTVAVRVTGGREQVTVRLTWTGRPTHPIFTSWAGQGASVEPEEIAVVDVWPYDAIGSDDIHTSVEDGRATVVAERVYSVRDDEAIEVYVAPGRGEDPRVGKAPTVGPVQMTATGSSKRQVRLSSDGQTPSDLSDTSASWPRLGTGEPATASLALRPPDEARSWGTFLVDWGHEKNPRWLWTTMYELLGLLPFIAGSVLSRRRPLRDRVAHWAGVVVFDMLLLLRALPALILGLNGILQLLDAPLDDTLFDVADRFGWDLFPLDLGGVPPSGSDPSYLGFFAGAGSIALLVTFVVGWPLVVSRAWHWMQPNRPLRPPRRVPWPWAVLAGLTVAGVVAATWVTGFGDDATVVAAAGLVLAWMAAGMARGVSHPGLSAALGVPAVVALAIGLQYFTLLPDSLDQTVSVVSGAITSGLVLLALVAAALVIVRAYFPETFEEGVRRARGAPLVTGAVVALLAISSVYLLLPRVADRPIPLNAFDVLGLGVQVRDYLPFLLLAAVVCELHRASDAKADAKPWGVLLMVAVLFEPTAAFWVLPLVGVLGTIGMLVLLGQRPTHPEVHATLGIRAKRLALLYALRRDEKLASQAERAARDKVAKGDAVLDEAITPAAHLRASIQERLDEAKMVSVDELDHAATALGPGKDEWESGWIGALCSAVLGLPWIVLQCGQVLDDSVDNGYVGLAVGLSLLSVVVKWVAIGFVLGYFHAYVRGRTAVWKGLSVGLVVVVPWLVHAATWQIPADELTWRAFALWAAQMLVHCVAVGVALEWVLVRRAASDRVETKGERLGGTGILIDLRAFRPVMTYLSGLVAALGATVVTVATGTLNNVLSAGVASFTADSDAPVVDAGVPAKQELPDAIRILWPPELERPG